MLGASAVKVGSTVIALIAAFCGCLAPITFDPRRHKGDDRRERTLQRVMAVLNCLAAGVIIALALLHLVPDSAHMYTGLHFSHPVVTTLFITCIGMLAVLFFEKALTPPPGLLVGRGHEHGALVDGVNVCHRADVLQCERECAALCPPGEHYHQVRYGSRGFRDGLESGVRITQHLTEASQLDSPGSDGQQHGDTSHALPISILQPRGVVQVEEASWTPQVLLLVMCLHSFLEGLTLGSTTSLAGTVVVTVAVLSHKALAGMALGISWCHHGLDTATHSWYSAAFALMTPLGSFAGMGISGWLQGTGPLLFSATCQALGAGTFLHVGLKEFLYDELDRIDDVPVALKCAAATAGFASMAWIAFIV
eukprot:TRINITY_DN3808_c0_g1_i1.p1 TRINITY_DN3808_c0_g1~~TRINITY_DN3808_c0_g1_i1.p1  ORF type:complete len:396 (+),score=91.87 TRINITY_DN3808_c0_g1_i1:94-1188(+)